MSESDLAFWKGELGEAAPALALSTERPGPESAAAPRTRQRSPLPAAIAGPLQRLSREEAASPFTTLLAAFQALLHRYTGQDRIAVGCAVEKPRPSGAPLVNTLVVCADVSGEPSFRELLRRVQQTVEEACAHGDLPFEDLLRELRPEGARAAGLFQLAFALSSALLRESSGPVAERSLATWEAAATAQADLAVTVEDSATGLDAVWEYDPSLLSAATLRRMAGHLDVLLRAALADPDRSVAILPLLPDAERQQLLMDWNATEAEFPRGRCLHQLFEEQAQRAPEAVALIFGDQRLSYRELDERANRLARHLRRLGAGPEVLVAICAERSVEMVVGILGILKSGGAYVPVDPAYPRERQGFMLQDARAGILVTQRHLLERLPTRMAQVEVVSLDADWPEIARQSAEPPASGVECDNLAYVIYTSGSTGRPKGIALRHAGVVNNLADLNRSFGVGPSDRVLAISSLSFDMCVYEVLGTLAAGGAIVMPDPEGARDVAHWAELVSTHRVTVWNSAPPLLEMLVSHAEGRPGHLLAHMRVAILGGDWVPVTLPDRLKAQAPGVKVIVLGGATEASIHSIVYPVDVTDPAWRSIPYGRPMANQRAYVLDPRLQLLPVGVAGELHLGGVGLARGYFGRPDLTAEKFVPNPFGVEPGDRIYKTGDLARYLPDGNIELLGRMDHQVKIRGHRIELGEISGVLREHPAVEEAVVMASQDDAGQKRLVAYVVPRAEHQAVPGQAAATVAQWQAVYEATYSQTGSLQDPVSSFVGWISSYTGRSFADAELKEYVDHTVERILSLRPRRVLEIGVGTGLLMFRVAPYCTRYDASDVSPTVLRALRQRLGLPGQALPQVTLAQRAADDFAGVEAEAYDTVIINSVTQHFPDVDYMLRVMEGAVRAVRPGGAVFVGDVRSLPLLEAFHASIERQRAAAAVGLAQLRRRVRRRMGQEKELFADPAFFLALRTHLPRISRAEVRLRRGRHHNEMTKFHFDAILRVDEDAPAPDVAWLDWRQEGLTLAGLRRRLEEGPEALALARVPNARLGPEIKTLAWLASEGAAETESDGPAAPEDGLIDPEDLWALGSELRYSVEVAWSAPPETGCCDVLFRRACAEGSPIEPVPVFPADRAPVRPWRQYTNTPFQEGAHGRLLPPLRSFLQERLPDYMVPQDFVFLDEMPLSPNGKLDRRALPAPDPSRPDLLVAFVGPRTPVEEVLAGLWAEVLGLERVGVDDNFFELGGHSLTATRVIARVHEAFPLTVPLRTLFETSTVASFAEALEAAGRQARIDLSAVARTILEVSRLGEDEVRVLLAARGADEQATDGQA